MDDTQDLTLQKLQALHASVEDAIKQLRQVMAQIEDETLQLRRERAMNAQVDNPQAQPPVHEKG